MRQSRPVICVGALLLACAMGMMQVNAVYAEAETEEITFPFVESEAEQNSTLTGTIKVELLSVTMPAGNFDFNIDPEAPFDIADPEGRFSNQVTSPGIHVTNNSVVPVKLEISQVVQNEAIFDEQPYDGGRQSFRLVDQVSGVGPPGTAILVLGAADQNYGSEREFEQYALVPGKQDIFIANIEAEKGIELKLYGKAAPDFYGSYRFTISPTLKISAVQAQPAD